LDNVVARYGGHIYGYAQVSISTAAITVQNSLFEQSSGHGLLLSNLPTILSISGNTFSNNGNSGLSLTNQAKATITANTISDNDYAGIYVENNSTVTIENNTAISNNGSQGIYVYNSTATITNNPITANGGYGIYATGSTLTITSNTLSTNTNGAMYLDGDSFSNATLSGNTISGNGLDTIVIGGTLSQNDTWGSAYGTYVVDQLTVDAGITLTIDPGVVVKFLGAGHLTVNGTLVADASAGSPITFTSLKDDTVGGDTNGDGGGSSPARGNWDRLIFASGSTSSILDNVEVRYGGNIYGYAQVSISTADITVQNSLFEQSSGYGIGFYNLPAGLSISGNTFSNNGNSGISVDNSTATITASTISDNDYYGIYCTNNANPIIGGSELNANSFYGNSSYAVYNDSTTVIDATHNYWGDPSGPYHPTLNPTGTGDPVSDYVTFDPWIGQDPFNQAPMVSDIPDQTIDEGGSFAAINLDDYVDDSDNADAELTWTYSGNTDLTVSIDANRVATIGVPAGWSGAEVITFTATDPGNLSDADSATFTVIDTGLGDGSACNDDAECASENCVNAVTASWYPTSIGACCPVGEYWVVDHCELCTDVDGDEVCEDPASPYEASADNCPNDSNPDQADANADGVGDVCDTVSDTDGDGLTDADEVNIHGTLPDNPDSDGDWINDGDEVNTYNTDPNDPNNFTPLGTGAIRGTLKDTGDNPITSHSIEVQVYTGDPCGQNQHVTGVSSDATTGTYAVVDLDTSQQYFLRTVNWQEPNYVNEWWASPSSSIYCHDAQPIDVIANTWVDNTDFQLDLGGSVSGQLTTAGGLPIEGLWVNVYSSACDGSFLGFSQPTGLDGNYTVYGLPAGDVYVHACGDCGGANYVPEWWDGTGGDGSVDCNGAAAVAVSVNQDTPGIDFALEQGGSITGFVKDSQNNVITSASISVHAHGTTANLNGAGVGVSQIDGSYTISGLAPGFYKVEANNNREPAYVAKYYDDKQTWEQADTVEVTAGGVTQFIDFTLEEAGAISGYVYEEGGSIPVVNACVNVSSTAPDWNHVIGWCCTDQDGFYTIGSLPGGNYYLKTHANCNETNPYLIDEWYADGGSTPDGNQATAVQVIAGQTTSGNDFTLDSGGVISGTVLDQLTGQAVDDSSTGSINLVVGWHKFVYRHEEIGGGQSSRSAYMAPGATEWKLFGPAPQLDVRTSEGGLENGIILINKKNNCAEHPRNHSEMIQCVDIDATEETDWYGQSVVQIVDHDENIHGNDEEFTSYYEAYFYVDNPGIWFFSTDSDDASEIVIDDQVVASWYGGHSSMARWEHKFNVDLFRYDTQEHVENIWGDPDGSYTFSGLPAGSYYIEATAPGYVREFYQEELRWEDALEIPVAGGASVENIDFSLSVDSDFDEMADDWETDHFGDLSHDGSADSDDDNLSDRDEFLNGTVPTNPDSDGDWVKDGDEINNNTNPNDANDFTPSGTGAIRGTISDSGGTPITAFQIDVEAISGDPCGGWQHHQTVTSNSLDGTYVIVGLAPGAYYLKTENRNESNYLNEWWASPSSSTDCSDAQVIAVTDGGLADSRDFQLDLGAQISGTVYEGNGGTPPPLTGEHVRVEVLQGEPCGEWQSVMSTQVNSSTGDYNLNAVPLGTYYLKTWNDNQSNYVNEWWESSASSISCSDAESFNLDVSGKSGMDFQLDLGGSVSGNVIDNISIDPIEGLWMHVFTNACGGEWLGGAHTELNGDFTIYGLPSGNVYLQTCSSCQDPPLNYVDEWWDDADGSTDCNGAKPIAILPGQVSTGKNFQLDSSGSISGFVTRDSDGQAVEGVSVVVWDYETGNGYGNFPTLANGSYTITGLPSGNYRLMVRASGTPYAGEYYDNAFDWDSATPVPVTAGAETSGTNFGLGLGGSISGVVTRDSDGLPVDGIGLYVHDFHNGTYFGDIVTQPNGSYTLSGLPPGDYRVEVDTWDTPYVHEYYDNTYNYNEAQPVSVSIGIDTPDIDFSLASGGSISGNLYDGDGNVITDTWINIHAIPLDGSWDGWGTQVSHFDGSFEIMGLLPGDYKILANNHREPAYETKYYPDNLSLHTAQSVTVAADQDTALPLDINLGSGPPVQAFTLWMQKRARVFTYKNDFQQALEPAQKVHVKKEFWIERWDEGQATLTAPAITWEPGEAVENVYVDIDGAPADKGILPDTSINPNLANPRYEWTNLPDYTADVGWLGVVSAESATTDIQIPADFKRTVDIETFNIEADQVVTLEVTVYDANIRRLEARIYFDDEDIVDADVKGGDGSESFHRFRIENPASGQKYTFTKTLTISPKNSDGHPIKYIPKTRLRLYYPYGFISDNDVSINGNEITVNDSDIGTFTITPGTAAYWDAVYKESYYRIELEQRSIIEEIGAAPPYITARTPADNAVGFPVGQNIEISFSEPMDTQRTEQEFSLYDENGNAVHDYYKGIIGGEFSWNANDDTLTFNPTNDLKYGTGYAIEMSGRDKVTEWMRWTQSEGQWDFVTVLDPADNVPPEVVATWPFDSAVDVSTAGFNPLSSLTHITAIFSEAMDPSTLSVVSGNITFKETASGAPVLFDLRYHLKLLEIIPDAPLSPNTEYEISLSTGIKDVAGNALPAIFFWQFTTGSADTTPPQVLATKPANGAIDIDIWYPRINIYFSEEIDPSTVNATTVTLEDDQGNPIDYYAHYWHSDYGIRVRRGTNLKFMALSNNTSYTVTVGTGVKDRAGNALAAPYQFSFTTVASEGNSFPRFDRIRRANVTRFLNGVQFDFLLYGDDNDWWWPDEKLDVTFTDGSSIWDIPEIAENWTFHYKTATDLYETIGSGDQTITFLLEDTAGNAVSHQQDVFVFSTIPVITSPAQSAEVFFPINLSWNVLSGAQMYEVTVYDDPDIELRQNVWKTFIPDNGNPYYGMVIPEDAGLSSGQTYYAEVIAWRSVAGNRPPGAANSELVGFIVTEEADTDGDGIPNIDDNCPDAPNPGQEDSDLDGIGDVCDLDTDTDGDGIPDIYETNTGEYVSPQDTGTDPNNPDTDGDGRNDGREVAQGTNPTDDTSFSGIPDTERAALIELYISTDGDNWSNNSGWEEAPLYTDGFAMPGTENTWYGVECDLDNTFVLQINLNSNSLSGLIPADLGNLTGLQTLFLMDNQITGDIPQELANLQSLDTLNLAGNQITGSIPSNLGTLLNLNYLGLQNNLLSGNIPPELLINTRLFYLGLSGNRLTGVIPSALGDHTDLVYLYLQGNQLSGEIPTTLTNLVNLSYTDIGYNALYTNDSALQAFLETRDPDWSATQTIAPSNISVESVTDASVALSWTAIPYTTDGGGYEVYYATNPTGPYTLFETTADKTITSSTITGLDPLTTYYFRLRTVTNPHANNQNAVYSKYTNGGLHVMYALWEGIYPDWQQSVMYMNNLPGSWSTPETVVVTSVDDFESLSADVDQNGNWHMVYNEEPCSTGTGNEECIRYASASSAPITIVEILYTEGGLSGSMYALWEGAPPDLQQSVMYMNNLSGSWSEPVPVVVTSVDDFEDLSFGVDQNGDWHAVYNEEPCSTGTGNEECIRYASASSAPITIVEILYTEGGLSGSSISVDGGHLFWRYQC
jgi:parallel beta-helix repeat protein